jgi:glutathione S-transferase
VLELYHNINSVCAQKVRIALHEKGQEAKEHLLTLRGDQNEPGYLKLNPNGVVPTLVHDGRPIVESSLILYYIDDTFPEPSLMPKAPLLRFRVRMYNKLIDEYLHNACTILTFATAFRPNFLKVPREVWLAEINKAPLKRRAEYKRSVIEHGLDSEFATDALAQHQKLLSWMAVSLKGGPYLSRRQLLQRRLRGDPLYPPARAAEARSHVDAISRHRRLVAAHARATLGQGDDLRSHDRQ